MKRKKKGAGRDPMTSFCLAFFVGGCSMSRKLSDTGSEPVHLRVDPAQAAMIDRSAEREGVNRSAVIRELIGAGYRARAIEHLANAAEEKRT